MKINYFFLKNNFPIKYSLFIMKILGSHRQFALKRARSERRHEKDAKARRSLRRWRRRARRPTAPAPTATRARIATPSRRRRPSGRRSTARWACRRRIPSATPAGSTGSGSPSCRGSGPSTASTSGPSSPTSAPSLRFAGVSAHPPPSSR